MKLKRSPLILLLTLIMVLQGAVLGLTAFAAGTNLPYVTEYGLYDYVDSNTVSPSAVGTVITTGCDGATYVQPPWPTLIGVSPVFESNVVIGIKFAVNVATPTYYDANITKFHMYDASNNEVAINVKRAGDGTSSDINRNYLYVTPQGSLQPSSTYKIVVDSTITSNNAQQPGIQQEVNFTTTAATTIAPELTAGDASGAPGAVIQVPVTLTSSGEVVAMQFDLSYDPNLLTFQQRSKGSLTSDFSVSTNKLENNDIRVVIYNDQNIPVAAGSGTVVQLQFQVAAAAPAGGTSVLELKGVTLSDADEQPITTNVNNGQFTVLQPPDTTAPAVSSSDPVSGAAGIAIDKTVAITFSEDLLAGDAYNQISLKDAGNNSIGFTKSISGNVLSLNPDANLGYSSTYTVTVPAGAVEDAAGNGLASAYSLSFTTGTAPDTTAPSVSSSDPVGGATGVAIEKTVAITFSEDILAGDAYNQISLKDASNNSVAFGKSISGNVLSLDPDANLSYSSTYTVTVPAGAVKDAAGNDLASAYTLSFTTPATPELTAGDASGAPGAVIQVPVTLTSSGEVVAMQFDLSYDSNLLTYQQRSKGSLTSEFSVSTNKLENNDIRVVIYHDQNISVAAGSGTVVQLQFQVAAAAPAGGTSVLELKGVILSDADEQPITTDVNNGQFTVLPPPDTTAPAVSSSDPVDGAAGVAIDKTVAITFSESILEGSAYGQISLKDGDNNSVLFTKSIINNVLRLDPSSNLGYNSNYTVVLPANAVKDQDGNELADKYELVFTTTTGPTITVISPNGNESWTAGTSQNISWNYTGNPGSYIKIELLKGSVVDRVINSGRLLTSGTYTWNIPTAQPSGDNYSVRLTSNSNSSYTDTSDATFTIVGPPAPSITVVAPNGSETWVAGVKQTISWNYTGSPGTYVKIELLKGGIVDRVISSSRPISSGAYAWSVPISQASGDDYSVRVTSNSYSSCTDTSDATFTVVGPPAPSITVATPNGSETWAAGTKQTISWNYTGSPGSFVKIELLKGGIVDRVISSSMSISSGSYTWTIPTSQASGDDYSVRVTSRTNGSYTDTSDATFTIVGPPAPSITVATPNGSETWEAGTKQTISWNYTGSPGSYVKIELLKGGVVERVISSSRPITSGKYQWTIPTTVASGDDYSVRVTSRSNSSYTDTSNATFTIIGPPAPSITVAAPNGSETWEAGTKQTISWNYTGSPGSYVKIELLKGGVVDRLISSSRPITSGKYQWTIPSTLASGDDYSVRVTSRSNSSYTDTSDATFTIVGPSVPSITVATPNGSETWAAGTKQTISWNYTGSPGSYVKIELLKGGVYNRLISSSRLLTSGAYTWTIPTTLASGDDYSVRVTSRSNSSYTDSSDASFTITGVSEQ